MGTYFKFLAKNKLYSFVTIFGFAIALMFVFLLSVYVKQELSVDQFHKNKDRLYLVVRDNKNQSPKWVSAFSNPIGPTLGNSIPEIETYTRIVHRPVQIEDSNKNKVQHDVLFADSSFFSMFSFPLLEGNPSQVLATKESAVLSRSYARKVFSSEDPIGKTINFDGTDVTVTGVMEDFPLNTQFQHSDMVVNYRLIEKYWGNDILNNMGNSSFGLYVMIYPGTDILSKAPMITESLKESYWVLTNGFSTEISFINLPDVYFGDVMSYFAKIDTNSKRLVSIYLIITALILLIAILNYINLSVSQAFKRGKESAIRKLLGSSRKAIIIQYISESTMMAFLSLGLGVLFAFLSEPFFDNVLSTTLNLSGQFTFGFTSFLLLGIFLIGFVAGLFPALIISGFDPIEIVKGTFKYKVNTVYSRVLIIFQYAVAIALLIYSTFITRQTDYMMNYDMGFNTENVYIMSNTLSKDRLPGLKDRLMTVAGVEKISFAAGTPIDGGNNNSFNYKGEPVSFQVFQSDSAFFDIFGIERYPNGIDANRKIYLNPKGYNILEPDSITQIVKDERTEYAIAGLVNDFHYSSLHKEPSPLMIILDEENMWPWSVVVKIAKGADIYQTTKQIDAAYSDYNGGSAFDAGFADETVQKWYEQEKKNRMIIGSFTLLTVVILLMGIMSMALYYVRQKEKEIAMRKVQGATEFQIITMLNMNFMRQVIIAFGIALPIAYFFSKRFLQEYPYHIELSWWVFLLAGVVISSLSALFVTIQSWRTATANPVDSLKNE